MQVLKRCGSEVKCIPRVILSQTSQAGDDDGQAAEIRQTRRPSRITRTSRVRVVVEAGFSVVVTGACDNVFDLTGRRCYVLYV